MDFRVGNLQQWSCVQLAHSPVASSLSSEVLTFAAYGFLKLVLLKIYNRSVLHYTDLISVHCELVLTLADWHWLVLVSKNYSE